MLVGAVITKGETFTGVRFSVSKRIYHGGHMYNCVNGLLTAKQSLPVPNERDETANPAAKGRHPTP